jgi:hypothetical protein
MRRRRPARTPECSDRLPAPAPAGAAIQGRQARWTALSPDQARTVPAGRGAHHQRPAAAGSEGDQLGGQKGGRDHFGTEALQLLQRGHGGLRRQYLRSGRTGMEVRRQAPRHPRSRSEPVFRRHAQADTGPGTAHRNAAAAARATRWLVHRVARALTGRHRNMLAEVSTATGRTVKTIVLNPPPVDGAVPSLANVQWANSPAAS